MVIGARNVILNRLQFCANVQKRLVIKSNTTRNIFHGSMLVSDWFLTSLKIRFRFKNISLSL